MGDQKLLFKSFDVGIVKADADTGEVTGCCSSYETIDCYGDTIQSGAFDPVIKEQPKLHMLWQHDPKTPVGLWEKFWQEDNKIMCSGHICMDIGAGHEALTYVKRGLVGGLSVGFIPTDWEAQKSGGALIKALDLREVSLVTFPANRDCMISSVKSWGNSEIKQEGEQVNFEELKVKCDDLERCNSELAGRVDALAKKQEADVKAFDEYVKKAQRPDSMTKTELECEKKKFDSFLRKEGVAMTSTSGGDVLIPSVLSNQLYIQAGDQAVMRKLARNIMVSTPNYSEVVATNTLKSAWLQETDGAPDASALQFKEVKPTWGELAIRTRISRRLIHDSVVDLSSLVLSEGAKMLAWNEDEAYTKGDGNNKPKGIFAYETEEKGDKELTAGKLQKVGNKGDVLEAIYGLVSALNPVYHSNACFMMNSKTRQALWALTAEDGRPLWGQSLTDKSPMTLLGYPVVINDYMDDAGSNKPWLAFGDFEAAVTVVSLQDVDVVRGEGVGEYPYVECVLSVRCGCFLRDNKALKVIVDGKVERPKKASPSPRG